MLGGIDLSGYSLDEPLPDPLPSRRGSKGHSDSIVGHGAAREPHASASSAHARRRRARQERDPRHRRSRSPTTWRSGSSTAPATASASCRPTFPGALDDFCDLVIPELQRRGLFRTEYEGTTLARKPRPAAAGKPAQQGKAVSQGRGRVTRHADPKTTRRLLTDRRASCERACSRRVDAVRHRWKPVGVQAAAARCALRGHVICAMLSVTYRSLIAVIPLTQGLLVTPVRAQTSGPRSRTWRCRTPPRPSRAWRPGGEPKGCRATGRALRATFHRLSARRRRLQGG